MVSTAGKQGLLFEGSRRGSRMKATDAEIRESYGRTHSIYKVAKEFGMCPQAVHLRIKKLGIQTSNRPFTDEEKAAIRDLYTSDFIAGKDAVTSLAKKLGRTPGVIYTWACSEGLCNPRRRKSASLIRKLNEGGVRWIRRRQADGTYQNPQAGKIHSEGQRFKRSLYSKAMWDSRTQNERDAVILKGQRTRSAKRILAPRPENPNVSWKAGWRTISRRRIYFRSRWEYNYGLYLQSLLECKQIANWEHEPETFWFKGIENGTACYIPDFRVTGTSGVIEYHEVKGWMDRRSKTKLRLMKKYHPNVTVRVIGLKWFKKNGAKLAKALRGWEGAAL